MYSELRTHMEVECIKKRLHIHGFNFQDRYYVILDIFIRILKEFANRNDAIERVVKGTLSNKLIAINN